MRRRDFITFVGGGAAWPRAARAQQPIPVVGFLSGRSAHDSINDVTAFRRGLAETDYVEGRNMLIEFRWAQGQIDRLPGLAMELVRHPVVVLAAVGGAAHAAKAATSTIPIIFGSGEDPINGGLVTSLGRPQGNITGATFFTSILGAKRLGLLRELVPGVEVIALLVNPNTPVGKVQTRDVEEARSILPVSMH
jgi:putative ABC transport system substrate-binding protein